jgi:SAM-dependent methyltransferase
MSFKKYIKLAKHYESCLNLYGDSHKGVDWPDKEAADRRYQIMLEVVNQALSDKSTVLDFGCGASHLYEYILERDVEKIEYTGLDISSKFIELSKKKFPLIKYYCLDILDDNSNISKFDYIILNGVFTEKRELSFEDMFDFFKKILKKLFIKANVGIAFNVMSTHVDWEREDLFHMPFDLLAEFLTNNISRNFIFRNDYGLFEYTTYVYKEKNI